MDIEIKRDPTYFACLEIEGDIQPMFAHFYPALAVLPGETVAAAHARQSHVAVAILREPLVPPGPIPGPAEAPVREDADLSPLLIRQLAPLVWQHVARYGFAPVPWNPATWRGSWATCPGLGDVRPL